MLSQSGSQNENDKKEYGKSDIYDPRTYCYNLASKNVDVCVPKSCNVAIKGIKDNNEEESPPKFADRSELIPTTKVIKSCTPSNGPQEDDHLKSDGGWVKDSDAPTEASMKEQTEREKIKLDKLMGISTGPAAALASFGSTQAAKESLASTGGLSRGGAIICECCHCYPCICTSRGMNEETLMAALKKIVGSGEDLNKIMSTLEAGSKSALESIIEKESVTAAEWATGGSVTSKTDKETEYSRKLGSTEADSGRVPWEAWIRGDFDEMSSCHCLPGMCPCPNGHFVLKTKKLDNLRTPKKKIHRIRKKVKKIGKDGKEYEEWDWVTASDSGMSRLSETCVCPPTKHFLTPASSESEVSGGMVCARKRIFWSDLMVCSCPKLQRTLAIIKPECVKFKDVVMRAIQNYGLDVLAERKVQLSPEEASEIYAKFYGTPRFPNMVVTISQAPIIALSLGGVDVVKIWNHMIGPDGTLPGEWFLPDWINRKFEHSGDIVDALHGSKNLLSAEDENRYFFPETYIDPIMKSETSVADYIKKYVNPTLIKGLTLLARKRPIDPIVFLAEFLLTNNPSQPHFPNNIALSPV